MQSIHKTAIVWACIVLLAVSALALGGCKKQDAPMPEARSELEFFDSFSFDRHLSSALKADPPEVTVTFPAVFTLNSIPERLDHWFSKVEEYGGEVKLVPESDTGKGIFSEVMSFFVAVYDYLKEKAIYHPVSEYNVRIHFKKSSGIVTKVVFERKPDAVDNKNKQ